MGFFEKVKSFFNDEEDEGFYEGDRWINIEITIMSPYSELVNIKKWMKPFAEELDWEIQSGNRTEETDIKRVNITLQPKENKRLTPEEFLENKDKLLGLTYAIHRDLLHEGDNKKAQENFKRTINITYTRLDGANAKKSDWTISESAGFLNYNYPLVKRINFEKKNKEKAVELFGKTVEEDIKSIFSDKEPKKSKKQMSSKKKLEENSKFEKELEESSKKMKQELKDLFGFNI